MTPEQYPDLQAELIAGHPISGAYNVDDQIAADQINALDVTRTRANMTGAEILETADPTEYAALTADKKAQFLSFTSGNETINPEAGGIAQQIIVDIFGGGSATVTALSALRQETISRADELGFGAVVIGDIQNARAL
jgi:hypothetical protein